jgi:hypothetical protein
MAGVERVGDPIVVLPRLFHLLWLHELLVDETAPLGAGSRVWLPEAA